MRAGSRFTVPLPRRKAAALLTAVGLCLLLWASPAATPQDKKKGKQPVSDTLILVSTFAETGQTLRGARVWLSPSDKDGKPLKGKRLEGVTNNMGEVPFHVPKTEAHYVLKAESKGFTPTEKVVFVSGEDQQDVFLQLAPKK